MVGCILFLLVLVPLRSADEGPSCPLQKKVGCTCYERVENDVDTSEYGCTANCTYIKVDNSSPDEDMFCFKSGTLPVSECEPIVSNPRIRKNLASLSSTEMNNLISALKEAKESAYTWPVQNVPYFNSPYDAAVSFHGYPGLCIGAAISSLPLSDAEAQEQAGCCIHGYSTFLPWHRLFMVQLEDALRKGTYKDITLPYWDWTQNFIALPHLVTDETQNRWWYHSKIPGISPTAYTERSAEALIDYNHYHCLEHSVCYKHNIGPHCFCPFPPTVNFPKYSLLGDLVLTALEELYYESFENLIEVPHNQFHNQLGFTPNDPSCLVNGNCYEYTMQNTYWAAFDPIFLIFHTMVDYQWAIWQALQKYRCLGNQQNCPLSYKNDCHPSFTEPLKPFSLDKYNSNCATKSHPTGQQVVNYTKALSYEYDNLTLFGMPIPELDEFLKKRNTVDRLFAGFSLPSMNIHRITFNICYPITNCIYPSPIEVTKVNKNKKARERFFENTILTYIEVTHFLPYYKLKPSQDIGFKIVSSSIPNNVTFTPVSIFRKAGTQKDRITVHWTEDYPDYHYAPFFKTHPKKSTSMRFLVENGSMAVYLYPDKESFKACSNSTLVSQEIPIDENTTFYFQNPLRPECIDENKLRVDMSKPCNFKPLKKDSNGNGTIGWQIDMTKYKDGICMEPGTRLTFEWDDYHNIRQVANKDDFIKCRNVQHLGNNNINNNDCSPLGRKTFPPLDEDGFKLEERVYYIVCPCGDHCTAGMKLKIYIKQTCPN